jgi:carboxyl-terminal processing protease
MRTSWVSRGLRVAGVLGGFSVATFFALNFRGTSGYWQGLEPALAATQVAKVPYDLTRLEAVNETLKMVRDKYVDPDRVKPREMLLSALNEVQKEIAQVIVVTDDANEVTVRVENQEKKFRTDDVLGPWDVSARLREVFTFLQKNLKDTEVDLRQVEYAACNGMLRTLDPHSVFLTPEGYKEMTTSTSGAFGGLGIVISIRDGQLTVMNPMPDTPAGRAGVKKGDRIVQINGESTVNMPIDDAVRRLRGEPRTKVTVWIVREGDGGWAKPKAFELEREVIKVKSVEAKQLDGNVGYIRLKQFQQSSSEEVGAALMGFRSKGPIKGLVLDLRGNPGGLLEQASKIADRFLSDGVIVSTVGASEGREDKTADPAAEPGYPIVVLVSGNSASASEIVAGALKNQGRALIVGQTTFGKGSVQLVFPEVTPEKAALKLTIAQYLTPGDVSIQGVGVTPDVELDPMTIDELEMDLFTQQHGVRERDLSAHLSNSRAAAGAKPLEVVRYHFSREDREAWRSGDVEDTFQLDFPVRFGRELAARMPADTKRLDALKSVKDYIEQARQEEVVKVAAELKKLGIDWSDAPEPTQPKPELEVKVETDRPGDEVTAGESIELRVTVKNLGKTPVFRLRGTTESDNGSFDGRELVFGKLKPGESRTAKVPLGWCEADPKQKDKPKKGELPKRVCKLPMDQLTRQDALSVRLEAAGTSELKPVEIRPTVKALERPMFKYSLQLADDRGGNGDGRLQPGERATAYLTVKNVGKGKSFDTQANLANLSGEALLLQKGRFDISNMAPGDTRRVSFTFDVASKLPEPELTLSLSVADRDLREYATEKVKVPVEVPLAVKPGSGVVAVGAAATPLLPSPGSSAPFGQLGPGTTVSLLGTSGEFSKVDLGAGRFGFVSTKDVSSSSAPAPTAAPTFFDAYSHAPPQLEVSVKSNATREEKTKVVGVATGNEKLLDAYVFVGSRKVFYKSNKGGADPKKMSFELDAALRPGVNFITVFARESADSVTRRTVIVRKDAPDGATLKTPKSDDVVAEWLHESPAD